MANLKALWKMFGDAKETKEPWKEEENEELDDSAKALLNRVNGIIMRCRDIVREDPSSDLNFNVRVTQITKEISESVVKTNDGLSYGILKEVVTFLLGRLTLPFEDVHLCPVLFDSGDARCHIDDLNNTEPFNFVLCYAGDDWINTATYPSGVIYRKGPRFKTQIE